MPREGQGVRGRRDPGWERVPDWGQSQEGRESRPAGRGQPTTVQGWGVWQGPRRRIGSGIQRGRQVGWEMAMAGHRPTVQAANVRPRQRGRDGAQGQVSHG